MGWFFDNTDEISADFHAAGAAIKREFDAAKDYSQDAKLVMAADLMIAQTQAQLSFIGRRIRQLHEQHDAQIATLASRIAELESSITEANVVDKGVWRGGIAYRKGEAGHVQRIAVDCAN